VNIPAYRHALSLSLSTSAYSIFLLLCVYSWNIRQQQHILLFWNFVFRQLTLLSDSQFSDGESVCFSADESVWSTVMVSWESPEHTRSYACLHGVWPSSLET
jgi:hypothetical protein